MAASVADFHISRNTQAADTGTYQLGIDVIVGSTYFPEAVPENHLGNGLIQKVEPGI